jgi:hypothetical protein
VLDSIDFPGGGMEFALLDESSTRKVLNMKTTMLRVAAVSAALLGLSMPALAFSGYYAPANWSELCSNGGVPTSCLGADDDGSVLLVAPGVLVLTGSDTGSGLGSRRDFAIMAQGSGTFSFDWTYTTFDSSLDPQWDPAGWSVGVLDGGSQFVLDNVFTTHSGSKSLTGITAGQWIGFHIGTFDNQYGRATLTISNFAAPVPEPASVAMMSLGLLGIAAVAARRRRSN